MLSISSYKQAAIYYLVTIALLFSWFPRYVVAPDRQELELGLGISVGAGVENNKFSDYTNCYVPEISEQLFAARSGWLPLWTNKTELGRPLYQISGFSAAYLPSWIVSRLARDPWHFLSALSLCFCLFAGFFMLLFAREMGLHPMAGLFTGISLAASPLFMYWLTFPMFPAVWCWSAGALWSVTRMAKHRDLLAWSALAFSGYSLLMTAYPQPVVFHAYLLGAYCLWLSYHQVRLNRIAMLKFAGLAGSAVILGAALAFPVYRDLTIAWSESARVAPDPGFFTAVLPTFASLDEVVRFFVLGTVPELFGNPIAPGYPFSYQGLSVTLIIIFFSVVGIFSDWRRTWGWWLAIVLLGVLALVHPLYVLGVKYLGFNLSRSNPLGSITLPLSVITMFGIDALASRSRHGELGTAVLVGGAITLLIIGTGVIFGASQHLTIRWGVAAGMLLEIGLLFAQYRTPHNLLLVLAVALTLAISSSPLILRQDPAQIAMRSPLVETVRQNLLPDSRYAVATPGISVLPPNLNATLGLASLHSYNSLSSTRYHTLVRSLGGEMHTYGRWNGAIAPDYDSAMFWMSNISLMLSPVELANKNLAFLGEAAGVYLYRVVSRMGGSLQVSVPSIDVNSRKVRLGDPRLLPRYVPSKTLDEGDVLEFRVAPAAPSVLVLSQKFHRDWHASVLTNEGWQAAQTVEVNGVFQGVLLPFEVSRVRLEFEPLARYAVVAHVFWLLLIVLMAIKSLRAHQRNVVEAI